MSKSKRSRSTQSEAVKTEPAAFQSDALSQPALRLKGVDMVSPADLRPHPKNPNKHPAEQIDRLADIIAYQGWRRPITVSKRSGFVTVGHGRREAALLRGWLCPVSYQDYESEDQELADLVADNAIDDWARLDFKTINEIVPTLGPDFDLDLLGLKNFTLDASDKDEQDAEQMPQESKRRCEIGDLWLLGEHRLVCGDASSITAVDTLMGNARAQLIFTDPPYNLGGEMDASLYSGSTGKDAQGQLADTDWDSDFDLGPALHNMFAFLSDSCSMYVCTSHFLAGMIWKEMQAVMDRIGWCVWDKPNPMPSLQKRHWTWSAELICYATRGKHTFHHAIGAHDSNVWRFNVEPHTEGHPTQKPVAIPEHAISHSSDEGDAVLDLFGGSGSTLIACERLKRRCYMMEISPKYCDTIIARWEKYTGLEARRAE